MFRNYLIIALRNIFRQKGYSFINIFGLAVGIAACMLVLIWVSYEFSFDQFHTKKENIFYVYPEFHYTNAPSQVFAVSFFPLAELLRDECPEVVDAVKYATGENVLIKYGNQKFVNNRVIFAEPSFLKIFSFPLIKGDLSTALSNRYSIVISEQMCTKYFGSEDPIGKVLNYRENVDLVVTGVINDVPKNSSLQFNCIVPYEVQFAPNYEIPQHWGGNPLSTAVLLHQLSDIPSVELKINKLVEKKMQGKNVKINFHLHPLAKLHLFSITESSLINAVTIVSIVAISVLLLACFNFININVACSLKRAKEVALRKVVGAYRSTLVKQFFSESLIITFLAFLISVVLCLIFLPTFNNFFRKQLEFSDILHTEVILGVVFIAVITGLLVGIYPAIYLSKFQPSEIIREKSKSSKGGKALRNVLVTAQFVVSLVLIIGTIAIQKQIDFILNMDIGFNKDNITSIPMTKNLSANYDVIKNELLRNSNVEKVTKSLQAPINISSTVSAIEWEGKNPQEQISFNWDVVDYDYFETFGIKIKEGRFFSKDFASDLSGAYIINETAAKIIGPDKLVGKNFSMFRQPGQIIGVVKDFNFRPLYHKVAPIVYRLDPHTSGVLSIKLKGQEKSNTLHFIENILKKFENDYPISVYSFNEAIMEFIYVSEQKLSQIAKFSTLLALIISCLGLLGLAAFSIEQRTKELGIRKVLGASAQSIFLLLSKEFFKWIVVANIIAWPIAYYLMMEWLKDYAYRIDLTLWLFILSGGIALCIALITVSYQTIKAAVVNPVESLRSE